MNNKERNRIRGELSQPTAVILVNEQAGGKLHNTLVFRPAVKKVEKVLSDWDGLGLKVKTIVTQNPAHAEDEAWNAVLRGDGLVLVKGGDGTIDNIANILRHGKDTQMGLLGGGRQNVLQRDLYDTHNPYKAFEQAVLHGRPREIDIGIVTHGDQRLPFLTNMDIGMGAQVLDDWNKSKHKVRLSMWHDFKQVRDTFDPYDFSIVFDGKEPQNYTKKALLAVINAAPYGGHLPVTESDMTDGKLEAIVVDPEALTNKGLIDLFSHKIQGTLAENGLTRVQFEHARITATNKEKIIFQRGGETQSSGNVTEITALHHAVSLWVPDTTNSQSFPKNRT